MFHGVQCMQILIHFAINYLEFNDWNSSKTLNYFP